MYIGHVAMALGAVRIRREAPLWVLLLASHWPDWLQLALGAYGAYNAQLYSHSLPAIAAGALLFTLVFLRQSGDARNAVLVAAVYLTHPLLDLVTGEKPLWPGGDPVGANWYDHPAKDFILELAIIVVAWNIYRTTFGPRRRDARLVVMLLALVGCQAMLDVAQELRLRRGAGDHETRRRTRSAPQVGDAAPPLVSPLGAKVVVKERTPTRVGRGMRTATSRGGAT